MLDDHEQATVSRVSILNSVEPFWGRKVTVREGDLLE